MNKSIIINIIKFIGSKNPKYQIQYNDKGWKKLPHEHGWRDQNNHKQGEWFELSNRRLTSKGNYVNDKREGEWIFYYNNGNPHEKGNFVNGKKEGKWIYYSRNGNILAKGNYVNDQLEGEQEYY